MFSLDSDETMLRRLICCCVPLECLPDKGKLRAKLSQTMPDRSQVIRYHLISKTLRQLSKSDQVHVHMTVAHQA